MKLWLRYNNATWLCVPRCGSQSVMAAIAARLGIRVSPGREPWQYFLAPTWIDWWTYGGTLPAGPLILVVRNPVVRFVSTLRLWRDNYPNETDINRILDQVELGSTEAHIAPISSIVSGLLAGREDDITYLKLEDIGAWAVTHGLRVHHANRGALHISLTPAQIDRVKAVYAADYRLLNY